MTLKKFKKGEKIYNTTERYPFQKFYIYNAKVSASLQMPSSSIPAYSFIAKNSELNSFKSVTTSSFNAENYGTTITGSSITFFSASMTRNTYDASSSPSGSKLKALKNTLNYYKKISNHYAYSSSLGNKEEQDVTIIDIPAWFYDTSIKKGTVDLGFYRTGSLIGRLQDIRENGELIQTGPSGSNNSGSVAGVCLYREGIMVLTGSWVLDGELQKYDPNNNSFTDSSKWIHYGVGINENSPGTWDGIGDISYDLKFKGVTKVPTLTMFCNANKGEFNTSRNSTFIQKGQDLSYFTSSNNYREGDEILIQNVASASYSEPEPDFEKNVYISRIYMYDKDKKLLGIAKTSRPIKKKENRDITFKLKLDL